MQSGIDIIEVDRIAKLVKNKNFLDKIFSKEEVEYCRKRKNSAQHYAVRFAAKEAIWKAVGDRKLSHRDISVKNDRLGKPSAVLPKRLDRIRKKLCISLSHTKNYAVALAILKM
ncbi:MAG: holo-[acyl-carrier-protein] synthase [Elusimicrobia bacterium RIFOXYA2_FULL_40_6]|nr:MAG: holo-[acyl-carrier-protein] synthase [Elusimicrobia bacterium RIFOXYA2_FULL_40_6]